jgi:hypothetical protein
VLFLITKQYETTTTTTTTVTDCYVRICCKTAW